MRSNLEVRIEGNPVEMDVRTPFELELVNSMLSIEAPGSSRALNVTLPFTPANHLVMGNIYHPQVQATKRNFPTDLYASSTLVDSGYLYLRDAVSNYPFDFTSNIREFFGPYQSRYLTDLTELGSEILPADLADTLATAWPTDKGYVFPTIKNETFYERNAPGGFDGLINKYDAGYVADSPNVPMFFVKNILARLGALAGVSFAGEAWDDPRFAALLLYNTRLATPSLDVRLYLPDLTVGQFILGLRKTFNLWLRFDVQRKRLRLDYARTAYRSPAAVDWSARMPRIQGGNPISTSGLELAWTLDSNDLLHKDDYFMPYTSPVANGGLLKIQSTFRPLMMEGGLPVTRQFGITPDQQDKKFVGGLLYWHGLPAGSPLASNEHTGLTLKWSGADGLQKAYWMEEEEFRQSGYRIERKVALNANDLSRISAILRGERSEAPIIHAHGTNYLVERLVVPSNNLTTSQLTAWRL
jgi:hypothetical protein